MRIDVRQVCSGTRPAFVAESGGQFHPRFQQKFLSRGRICHLAGISELIDMPDGVGCKLLSRRAIDFQRLIGLLAGMARNTAECDDPSQAANGIGAPTESEQENSVAGLPKLDQRRVGLVDYFRPRSWSSLSIIRFNPPRIRSRSNPSVSAFFCFIVSVVLSMMFAGLKLGGNVGSP
jgi:hypothetical protein